MGAGKLYVVATPIGNLEDITLRGLRVLGEADFIAAENARHTWRLLSRHGIQNAVFSYTRDKNKRQAAGIIRRIEAGETCALVSNAGTPGVSDPGPYLVRLAAEAGIRVEPVPGPSALSAAVSVSGMAGSDFIFLGYLSHKSGKRRKKLAAHADFGGSIVVYEGPHRLIRLLEDAREALGDRPAVVCRELTKKFEEVLRGRISWHLEHFQENDPRGEFTLVIGPEKAHAEE